MFSLQRKKICENCGTVAVPRLETRGSFIVEIILWMLLLLPGFVYTIWRQGSKYEVCSSCKAKNPIGLKTPRGRELFAKYGHN